MATVYYTKADSRNPELNIGVYVGIMAKKEAKEFVKTHNENLTDSEKADYVEYDYLQKDYSEDDFYNLNENDN